MTEAVKPTDLSPFRKRTAFILLAILQSTLIFTITMIAVPLPVIGQEFMIGSSGLLLVSASYGLAFSGLLLFGGRLADRYDGRRILNIGLFIFATASVAAALSPLYELLVTSRFFQGLGAALVAPAAMAILRLLYPSQAEYGKAMAVWGGVSVLGSALGFILSGAVVDFLSWRWMFVIPVGIALIVLLLSLVLFPAKDNPKGEHRPALDLPGAFLATAGISLFSFALIASHELNWTAPGVYGPALIGILFITLFFWFEKQVHDPLLPPGFILDKTRFIGLLGVLLAAAGAGGLVNFILSLYLQQNRGWSPLETAGAFVPFALVLIASGPIAARLVVRFGAGRMTKTGLVIAAAGLLLLADLDGESLYWISILPGLVFLAAGAAVIFSGTAVLATSHVPPEQAGLAGGVMNTAMELGPTIGLAGLMSIAALGPDPVQGYAWAFAAAGGAYLVTAVFAAFCLSNPAPLNEHS